MRSGVPGGEARVGRRVAEQSRGGDDAFACVAAVGVGARAAFSKAGDGNLPGGRGRGQGWRLLVLRSEGGAGAVLARWTRAGRCLGARTLPSFWRPSSARARVGRWAERLPGWQRRGPSGQANWMERGNDTARAGASREGALVIRRAEGSGQW